jgi:hypothetical protein
VLICEPSAYVSPSWSWASISQCVRFDNVSGEWDKNAWEFEPAITVVDVHCEVTGLNPYGRVSDGYLTLLGRLTEARLPCKDPVSDYGYFLKVGDSGSVIMYPDCILVVEEEGVIPASTHHIPSKFTAQVTCLLLGTTRRTDGDKDPDL